MSILDMGAGSGDFTQILIKRLHPKAVLAIECSSQMRDQAEARLLPNPIAKFVSGEIDNFTTQSQFDLIFSNGVLHYSIDHLAVL